MTDQPDTPSKASPMTHHREQEVTVGNGWAMLPFFLLVLFGSLALTLYGLIAGVQERDMPYFIPFLLGFLGLIISVICLFGFFTLQPNEARVLVLFGDYRGTVKKSGFHWGNPFYSNGSVDGARPKAPCGDNPANNAVATAMVVAQQGKLRRFKISQRARTFNGEKLKVNDKRGNPIEIAAVVVWRVVDTAQAAFDVDDFRHYVHMQSESALRHLASLYAYDHGEKDECTLRSNVDEVSRDLKEELENRFAKAGVAVEEARLTHLAYAPEIAQLMLRRQQAEAIIAARQKIVHGAVSMVEMALKDMADKQVVELDDERKASMVSNLMVVLCGESEVHPVINAGTLYS